MNPVPTWGAILKPDLALSMTLNLQFAIDQAYVARRGPLPTFTNATTTARTYVGSDGLLKTAATNVPRIEFDPITLKCLGLLIEEQRSNTLLRSEEFSTGAWSKTLSSVTADVATAPDGATTADKLVEDTSNNLHITSQVFSTVSGTTYTFSVYIKSAERTFAAIALLTGFPTTSLIVNLSTGAVTTGIGSPLNGKAQDYGNGWYRVSFSLVANSTTAAASVNVYLMNGFTWADRIYAGNGTSGILIWGAQVEAGSFASSYIPTTTTSLVRSADVCSILGAAFTGFYNQTEGTMVFKGSRIGLQPSPVPGYIQIDDGTVSERILLYNSAGSEDYLVTDNGLISANLSAGASFPNNTLFGLSARYKVNDFAVSRSGASPVTIASGSVPTTTAFRIGNRNTAGFHNGHIHTIQYFNTIKTNAQLQALSIP